MLGLCSHTYVCAPPSTPSSTDVLSHLAFASHFSPAASATAPFVGMICGPAEGNRFFYTKSATTLKTSTVSPLPQEFKSNSFYVDADRTTRIFLVPVELSVVSPPHTRRACLRARNRATGIALGARFVGVRPH